MLTLPILRKMLLNAAVELKANSTYLCELDSVAGDGDHRQDGRRDEDHDRRRPAQYHARPAG